MFLHPRFNGVRRKPKRWSYKIYCASDILSEYKITTTRWNFPDGQSIDYSEEKYSSCYELESIRIIVFDTTDIIFLSVKFLTTSPFVNTLFMVRNSILLRLISFYSVHNQWDFLPCSFFMCVCFVTWSKTVDISMMIGRMKRNCCAYNANMSIWVDNVRFWDQSDSRSDCTEVKIIYYLFSMTISLLSFMKVFAKIIN